MEDEPKHPDVAAVFTRLLAELSMSAGQFAKSLQPQTSQQAIQTYTSGKRAPGSKLLASIIKRYPAINAVWLMTGEGEPFPNGKHGARVVEPFIPTGTVNSMGATEVGNGELEAYLGENFGEDVGKPMGRAAAQPTDAKGFIKTLLTEIDMLKAERTNLQAVIAEQRESLKEQRENTQFLREQIQELKLAGKSDGNHYDAPGDYALAAEPPVKPIGFKVRMMYPNGLPDVVVGESEKVAA